MAKSTYSPAQHEAAFQWVADDDLASLRACYRRRSSAPIDPADQRRINQLMRSAADWDSAKCLRYLAVELGGDIHHTNNTKQDPNSPQQDPTTLVLAIYCDNAKKRDAMFQALMSVARADELDSRACHWTRAARAALYMGDDAILRDLATFAGSARFSQWIGSICDPDGEDAWSLAARGGSPNVIGILRGIPEMKARLDGSSFKTGRVADLAEAFGHTDFAFVIRSIADGERERESIENACQPANEECRAPSRRI